MKKGFTLIELLVVIAIIGILSSVVLASLNNARTKANDTVIKSSLANMRSQAQIYHDENNTFYPGFVDEDPIVDNCANLVGLMSDQYIINQLSAINTRYNASTTCFVGTSTYAISAALKEGGDWCVDSEGTATSTTALNTGLCQ